MKRKSKLALLLLALSTVFILSTAFWSLGGDTNKASPKFKEYRSHNLLVVSETTYDKMDLPEDDSLRYLEAPNIAKFAGTWTLYFFSKEGTWRPLWTGYLVDEKFYYDVQPDSSVDIYIFGGLDVQRSLAEIRSLNGHMGP